MKLNYSIYDNFIYNLLDFLPILNFINVVSLDPWRKFATMLTDSPFADREICEIRRLRPSLSPAN